MGKTIFAQIGQKSCYYYSFIDYCDHGGQAAAGGDRGGAAGHQHGSVLEAANNA